MLALVDTMSKYMSIWWWWSSSSLLNRFDWIRTNWRVMPSIPIHNYFLQVTKSFPSPPRSLFDIDVGWSFQGDHVWVDQRTGSEFNVEIGARVVATQAGQIVLLDDNEEVRPRWSSSLQSSFHFLQELHFPIQTKFRPMHISSVEGVNDMILLGDLKESAILHNLHMRYKEEKIYVSPLRPLSLSRTAVAFRPTRGPFWWLSIPINSWASTTSNQFASTVTRRLANYLRISSPSVIMPIGICNAISTINASSSVEKVAVARLNRRN